MTGRRAGTGHAGIALTVAISLCLAACGGSRQDSGEPSGTFPVSVKASFPSSQVLAGQSRMTIAVTNAGSRTVPDVAVTVNSFNYTSPQPGLADPSRPVWIVNQGPVGGQTAYTNTWALGSLPPGETRTFAWDVTAMVPGTHTISYQVAAGLNGKAKAQDQTTGGIPQGSFQVSISRQAPQSRVDPNTGRVIRSPPVVAGGQKGAGGGGGAGGNPSPGYGSGGPSSQQPGSGGGSQPSSGARSSGGGH